MWRDILGGFYFNFNMNLTSFGYVSFFFFFFFFFLLQKFLHLVGKKRKKKKANATSPKEFFGKNMAQSH
jgi:hypothetical protein